MSFSKTVKDELLKKDFTAYQKLYNMEHSGQQEQAARFLSERFLKSGSITDPEKDYHLEFSCEDAASAEEVRRGLGCFSVESKLTVRGNRQIVYLKDASRIADVLTIMGAVDARMRFENVRILKEVSENVNRRVNFEAANISRTVSASLRQAEDIRLIEAAGQMGHLPEELRELAALRIRYPDATLPELAEKLTIPVGKSGVSHRMRKLHSIAENIRHAEDGEKQ